MAVQIPEQFNDIIAKSEYVWFTTIRADGMPQPTPVWFVRDGDVFTIYTTPGSQKVKNIQANAKVALSVSIGDDAGEYVVIQGEAAIDYSFPLADKYALYADKYRESIPDIGLTLEQLAQQFNVPIRVTPLHVRGEGV
ncbi:MAG TPA: pyridoxamine 5'-phosphate oxidase family protein [Phototrophicaceae bacterium]|nr:pyridoxamine 5'-phosphate oxidase family protein [Phototrophicaceae bacterium]